MAKIENHATRPNGLEIDYRSINALQLPKNRARTHPAKQIEKIARSIEAYGFLLPILVTSSNEVIVGAGRLLAAKQLSYDEVPVILIEHLSEAQVKAFRLADNRLAGDARWDLDALKLEVEQILDLDLDFDLSLTGFELPEIDLVLHPAEPINEETQDPDDDLEPAAGAVSQRGDLWLLDEHRLMCGDATNQDDLKALLCHEPALAISRNETERETSNTPSIEHHKQSLLAASSVVAMVFTDPPYNVPVQGHISGKGRANHHEFMMGSGEMSDKEFENFLSSSLKQMMTATKEGGLLFVCMDWRGLHILQSAARSVGLTQINLIVWAKTNSGMGSLYRSQHELIAIFKVGNEPHTNNVQLGKFGRNRSNVWTYPGANSFGVQRDQDLADHPTVKPVAMVAEAIKDVTRPGDIVLDPFCGSGTLLLACERTGRKARGLELDPVYVDTALARFQARTGIVPKLSQTGETLSQVRERRRQEAANAEPEADPNGVPADPSNADEVRGDFYIDGSWVRRRRRPSTWNSRAV